MVISLPLVTPNFLDGENWTATPSGEDFASLGLARLLLRVDRDVEELAVAVAPALERCGLAVRVLQGFPFIERCPELLQFHLPALLSELKRFYLTGRHANNSAGVA